MIRPTVRSFWPLRVCALALVIGSQTNPAWAQFGSVVNIPPEPNIGDDQAMLGLGLALYDALYLACTDASGETHGWNPDALRAAR